MKKAACTYSLFILMILSISSAKGQISMQFNPAVHGRTLDGLSNVQILNSNSQTLKGFVLITVTDGLNIKLVQIKTPSFLIKPGVNNIDRIVFASSKFTFGNSPSALQLTNTGRFPEGELEYCFEVDISESKADNIPADYESCFKNYNQPFTPLLLISPGDGDEFCNLRPNFTWQPPVPLPADAKFRLQLSEVKNEQDMVEAISFNQPIINQGNISGNNLLYPPAAPDLKSGNTYAWQVTVYTGTTILTKSEVWTFTVKCDILTKTPDFDSYRELKENTGGDYYVARKILRFSFYNPYEGGKLDYAIFNQRNPSKFIKRLAVLKLKPGLNKYDLDLSEYNSFKRGQEYLLKVKLKHERILMLRFIYKDE